MALKDVTVDEVDTQQYGMSSIVRLICNCFHMPQHDKKFKLDAYDGFAGIPQNCDQHGFISHIIKFARESGGEIAQIRVDQRKVTLKFQPKTPLQDARSCVNRLISSMPKADADN